MIGQSLAFRALQRFGGPLCVFHAELGTVVVAEIEFLQIAMQMGFADAVINPIDPALEDGIVVLGGVDVDEASEAGIFVSRMVDGRMAGELGSGLGANTPRELAREISEC